MLKKYILTLLVSFSAVSVAVAQPAPDSLLVQIQKIEGSFNYETGVIAFDSSHAKLTVPKGFRYLDPSQSMYVLSDLWGNPVDSSVLGLLVPEGRGVLAANSWVFKISYENIGYVKDDDAEDIDYDDMLEELQKESKEANPERIKQGYPAIEFIGWAAKPHYDKEAKVLYWAKELKFGEDSLHTLNYEIRILGRKGVFVLNAIASMSELKEVEPTVNEVLTSVEFERGSAYSDFNPDIDDVAAWTIGSLVAGKILAKVGFFAVLLKFWKVLAIAVMSGSAYLWKFVTGRSTKKEEDKGSLAANTTGEETQPE